MPRYTPLTDDFTVNTNNTDTQTHPSVAALEGGGFVVAWTSNDADEETDGIAAQIFDANGTPIGEEFTVNTEVEASQLHPSVAALEGGGFVVTWYSFDLDVDGSSAGIAGQIFDAEGNTVGAEFTINSETANDQFAPDVAALPGGGFVVTWVSGDTDVDGDGYGISAQIFSAGGTKTGNEITVNTQVESQQYHPSVTGLEDGSFVITWYSYDPDVDSLVDDVNAGISAQIFSPTGNPVGSEFTVNSNTDGNQMIPTVTSLAGGGFIITWYGEDATGDDDGFGISAQIFDASGNAQGDEITVNTETEGDQSNPVVTALSDGGFVISWTSSDPDVDDDRAGISGQQFDGNGNPIGDEFTINADTASNQLYPSIDALEDGGFVVAWASEAPNADGDGFGIIARIFGQSVTEGTSGADTLWGDEWDNIISAGSGADALFAKEGDDSLMGDSGQDTIGGGAGNDTLSGGDGDDIIYANNGADLLDGGAGADVIFGGWGNDTVDGGAGDDTLWGGAGDDIFTGGEGSDVFLFGGSNGTDTVTDFDSTNDLLVLTNAVTDFTALTDIEAAATEENNGLLIDLGGGNSVFLEGLSMNDLAGINLMI